MNELRQKVRKIKLELNLSDRELSKRLGKSQSYLSKIFEVGVSTARQKALSDELDKVAKGELFISKEEYIKILLRDAEYNRNCMKQYMNKVNDLKQKLTIAKQSGLSLLESLNKSIDENKNLKSTVDTVNDGLRSELQQLGKEFHYARSELSKVDAKNEELKNSVVRKDKWIDEQNDEIKKLRQQQKIHRLLSLVCLATIILLIVTQ